MTHPYHIVRPYAVNDFPNNMANFAQLSAYERSHYAAGRRYSKFDGILALICENRRIASYHYHRICKDKMHLHTELLTHMYQP